jgi:hypothetical protein
MHARTPLSRLVFLIPAAFWLAACSRDNSSLPTGVDAASASRSATVGSLTCQPITQQQITALFTPGSRGAATSTFYRVQNDVRKGNITDAVFGMFQLWDYTLRTYYAGQLTGGMSAATQTATLAFGRSLYCLVGLDGSAFVSGANLLDLDNVLQVVFPSASDQTVVTGSKHAGVLIPGGTLQQPVTISISLITSEFTFPAGPLNTKLDQYGPFFEFKVVPQQTFNTPVVAAACIQTASGDAPPSSVDIAHNVGHGIEILPTAPVAFLACGAEGLAPRASAFELFRNGDYARAAKRLGSAALSLFAPTSAYATASGIGGKTKSFSPFGGVDTAIVVRLPRNFPSQPQKAAAGSDVASPPSVLVQTANGHTPLGGASVTFTVVDGGGSVGPASNTSAVTSVTVMTDNATGLAGVLNWTLGVGPSNLLTANASFSLPGSISGFPTSGATTASTVAVSGNPVRLTATSTDVIPYQASNYMYLSGAAGVAPGFQRPNFQATAQNGWQAGTAAFGSSNLGASCPALTSTVATTWPNNPSAPTDMLLRKTFTLPAWWTAGLTLGIAIDNDFQAFVDGVNVTPAGGPGYDPATGFVSHDGCATRDSFTIPLSVHGGQHLLAIRARDRGTAAYVDTRIHVAQLVR